MKGLLRRIALLLILPGLGACSSSMMGGVPASQAMGQADWAFAADAIHLLVQASPQLNMEQGQPHTLLLGVLQMKDSAPFFKLLAEPDALSMMMASDHAGDDFISLTRYLVVPGQTASVSLDRAQQAHFVALIAGYDQLGVKDSVRLFAIPLKLSSDGIVVKTWQASPDRLALQLTLGEHAILAADQVPFPIDVRNTPVETGDPVQIPLTGKDTAATSLRRVPN